MKPCKPLDDVKSVLPILSRISFLGGLTEEQRTVVFRHFEIAVYDGDEVVARHGEEPSHIYIIKRGRIELRLADADHTVRKREFQVGDCFGEAAMLALVNNTASFIALEPSELIVLSRRALNELRTEAPEVFCQLILNLARDLARKLQYTDEMLLRTGSDMRR
jgi:CRP/FNR family transcriptional regulator, cyclic AMP receptor protein